MCLLRLRVIFALLVPLSSSCMDSEVGASNSFSREDEHLLISWKVHESRVRRVSGREDYVEFLEELGVARSDVEEQDVLKPLVKRRLSLFNDDLLAASSPLVENAPAEHIGAILSAGTALVPSLIDALAEGHRQEAVRAARIIRWFVSGLRKERFLTSYIAAIRIESVLIDEYSQHPELLSEDPELRDEIFKVFRESTLRDGLTFVGPRMLKTIEPLHPTSSIDERLRGPIYEASVEFLEIASATQIDFESIIVVTATLRSRLLDLQRDPLAEVVLRYLDAFQEDLQLQQKKQEILLKYRR